MSDRRFKSTKQERRFSKGKTARSAKNRRKANHQIDPDTGKGKWREVA